VPKSLGVFLVLWFDFAGGCVALGLFWLGVLGLALLDWRALCSLFFWPGVRDVFWCFLPVFGVFGCCVCCWWFAVFWVSCRCSEL